MDSVGCLAGDGDPLPVRHEPHRLPADPLRLMSRHVRTVQNIRLSATSALIKYMLSFTLSHCPKYMFVSTLPQY